MGWTRFLRRRWWADERARELDAYLAIETDENLARGMSPEEARAAAVRKLGNRTLVLEDIYRMNTLEPIDAIGRDIRLALRLMRRSPGFTAVAVLSLALGIGANTALFQLLDAVRLRSLPVAHPAELVNVRITGGGARTGAFQGTHPQLTHALWERLQQEARAFTGLAAWNVRRFNLARGGEVRYAEGLFVSGRFFEVLGLAPALGRLLTDADDRPGCPGAAVVSYAFWQREFGGATDVTGRRVFLNGHPVEIVGVAPRPFFGPEVGRSFDLAVPICADPLLTGSRDRIDNRRFWWLAVMGRLAPGWSVERATTHLAAISGPMFAATVPSDYLPEDARVYRAFRLGAEPAATGLSRLRDTFGTPLLVLLGMTGIVLLVACANLASLLLARASAREREFAVRLALGASRLRLVRQLLVESLLLAIAGACLGVALAGVSSRLLVSVLASSDNPVFVPLGLDWRVFGFATALALVACVAFGLAPAVSATRVEAAGTIAPGSRGVAAGTERLGVRRTLVVAQVACSLVLLVGALLFARTLHNLLQEDVGFRRDGVLVVGVDYRRLSPSPDAARRLVRTIRGALQGVPGSAGVAEAAIVPLGGDVWNEQIRIDGRPVVAGAGTPAICNFTAVGPGYFEVLAIPRLAGRDFTDADAFTAPAVALVNRAFVDRFLGGGAAIGRAVEIEHGPGAPDRRFEVVGVVGDTKYADLRERTGPIVYVAWAQDPEPANGVQFVVRAAVPLASMVPASTAAIRDVSPGVDVEYAVLESQIRASVRQERLVVLLSAAFGALAAFLAALGLLGVLSYMVVRRRHEIGVRMVLGATRRTIVGAVLVEGLALAGAGLGIGAVLALAGMRLAGKMLYGVRPHDPVTLVAAAALLAVVAVVSAALPAARAARVEPLTALREN